MQIAASPDIDPKDPMIRFDEDTDSMELGAMIGAATYVSSKILGQTVGDSKMARKIRRKLPFMSYFIPPKGWLGWKEEVLNATGFITLGAAVGSVASGGELAQQFQMGLSDALSHKVFSEIIELLSGDPLPSPPLIDLVMVKVGSQIIRDELIPSGIPAFRGQTKGILLLNGITEITAFAFLGALEGALTATLYTQIREEEVPLKEYFVKEMTMGAAVRSMEAISTVIVYGPKMHVSESEKEIIEAYAQSRGIDIRWGLEHAQFRSAKLGALYSPEVYATDDKAYAYAIGRDVIFPQTFDPKKTRWDAVSAAHELYHVHQMAAAPHWIYLRYRYEEYDKGIVMEKHDDRIHEYFPSRRFK